MNPNPPPAPTPTAAAAEQSFSDSADTPQLNPEEIEPLKDGVVLIGDATSWPSLSESTRPPPRPSATDPPIAASQASAVSNSPQNHGHPTPNPNSFSTNPNRQRYSGRGGSGRGGVSRGGFIRHPVPPQQLPSPPPLPPAFFGGFEDPNRGPFFYGNGFGAHLRPTEYQFSQSSSSHWGGGRPRGYGIRHYNHANYRGPDWNAAPQGFHPRDVRFPHMGTQMAYPVPPQAMVPFPYMHGPVLSPEFFMGMPVYAGGHAPVPPPSLSPPLPVGLQTKLLNQINYYFSEENLIKDTYLRSKMDDGGWVPVDLIANFKKVRDLTQDIQLVRESLGASSVVEVQGDKMRRRNDWRRWIPTSSVTEEPISGLNTIIRYFQNATLEEVHADRSSSSATNASSSPREVLT